MSRWGLSGGPLKTDLLYAKPIEDAGEQNNFSPLLMYAIAWQESIGGEAAGSWNAATVLSGDGGHGLFQLTSSYPPDWEDPAVNARYAVQEFLLPAAEFWSAAPYNMTGDDLVRCIAAEFNAGRGGAMSGHNEGDVDKFTTDHYAARALEHYTNLVTTGNP